MNQLAKVEPHAAELEKIADKMDAAGIGGHPRRGHAPVLRDMAGSMRADAAHGATPYRFSELAAADDGSVRAASTPENDRRMAAVMKEAAHMLRRVGISEVDGKLDMPVLDRAMATRPVHERMRLKGLCREAGWLD
ncbi:MAG: hypothetical protein ACLPTZ_15620 [Beijerinckiaceae bacterium]